MPGSASLPAAAARVEHQLDVAVQLQERRRQLRRRSVRSTIRSTHCAFDFPVAISTMRRAWRIVAIPIDSASAGTLRGIAAEERGVAAARRRLQRHAVRARRERAGRLVEADVAVGADAEHLQVDAAGGGDRLLVARALGVGIRRSAVEEVDPVRARRLTREKRCSCMNAR